MNRDTIWRVIVAAIAGAGAVALLSALPALAPTEQRLGTTRSAR